MIIRHAEKPVDGGPDRGVSIDGFHAKHELTVRGWQRAASLVRYFAPLHPHPPDAAVATPQTIFASAATIESPSLRSQHTVAPLAAALGLTINAHLAEGDEAALAQAALAAPGPVLIAWHHHCIPDLARLIATLATSEAAAAVGQDWPRAWPDDRFDLVWTLDSLECGQRWKLQQIPQRLLSHDVDRID
jgi:hypothetical protein